MKNSIAIYALLGSSMLSQAQRLTEPHGEGSVVFGSPGGKWQKAAITDGLTGEYSAAYSLARRFQLTTSEISGIRESPFLVKNQVSLTAFRSAALEP
jgi:hypothetical protein